MGRRRKPENAIYPAGLYPSRGWLFWKNKVKVCRVSEWGTKAARDRWAQVSTAPADAGTLARLLDDSLAHRMQRVRDGTLKARTYEDNGEYAANLKLALGHMLAHEVTTRDCAGYLQRRAWQPRPRRAPDGTLQPQEPRRAPSRANKEMSFLSVSYGWALTSPDWPQIVSNPCTGLERNPETPRERCPERWEIDAAQGHAHGPWPLIFDLAYKCATRGVDARLINVHRQIRADGLYLPPMKGGDDVLIEWDPELYAIIVGLLAWRDEIMAKRHVDSPYLILARGGGPYTPHGWKTTVYKIVRAAIADPENPLEEPFGFHDIRARSATDEDELYGRNPKARLRHRRQATTDIYMRGKRMKRVKPLPLRRKA